MLTCRHCKEPRAFDGRHDRHGHVIFGQQPEEQAARATLEAINHLQIRHPEAFAQMNNIAAAVSGLALAVHMEYDGPEAKLKHQQAAAEICRAFGRVVTDEDIEKGIRKWQADHGAIFSDTVHFDGAKELLRQLRDTLSYADVLTPPAAPMMNGDVKV